MKQIAVAMMLIWLWLGLLVPAAAGQATGTSTQVSASSTRATAEYTLPPEKLAKAHALYRLQLWYAAVATLYGVAVIYLLLRWKVAVRFRDLAERRTGRRWLQGLVVLSLLVGVLFAADLPWFVYLHSVSVKYGFSVQSWGGWFFDRFKDLISEVVVGSILALILYTIIRRSPRRWWLYFWFASIPLILFGLLIKPTVIDPLYDRFEPLEKTNPALVAELEKVVHRGGLQIPPSRMFEMKASDKVTLLNAYVTGLGSSKRVVVWDTTEKKLTTPEIMFVFGHEMGHYVLGHVLRGTLIAIAGTFFLLYFLFRASNWAFARWGKAWHIRALDDWASLPLIWLIVTILTIAGDPISNAISRHMEHEADIYAMEVTHGLIPDQRQVAVHTFQVLGENGLSYPYVGRVAELLLWTHPTIRDRVRFVQEYDPWAEGKKPEFVKD